MRLSRLCFVIGLVILILLIGQLLLEILLQDDSRHIFSSILYSVDDYKYIFQGVTQPVILWWVPLGGTQLPGKVKTCGQHSCYFTYDHNFKHHPNIKMMVFYASNMDWSRLPLPRTSSVAWALLHEESPRNVAALNHADAISLFNYTATFSRHSSVPLTTQYLQSLHAITDLKYFVSTEDKSRLQEAGGLAPVMYLQSDCSTMTDRDSYVAQLANHIKVDSYGACLHNKDLPVNLQPPHSLDTMMADELIHLVARYRFTLAIENGVCHDYITEKLWRPLIAGSVPVYIGSPTVTDWLPNNSSAILGHGFESPKKLADYLHLLNNDKDKYERHLSHKLKSEITNVRLIKTMKERQWDIDYSGEKDDYVGHFECFLCEKAHSVKEMSVATVDHYSCPMPLSVLSGQPNRTNYWLDSWFYGGCEAKVIRRFVESEVAEFSREEYEEALTQLVLQGKCHYDAQSTKDLYDYYN